MAEERLVQFRCPGCKSTIYASRNAQVGHLCRKLKPRPKFLNWEKTQPDAE